MSECTRTVRLGDVARKIGSGATPRGGSSVYVNRGAALIRSQNVYDSHFTFDGLVHIDDEAARALDGVAVVDQDVLLNITGDSVARCCLAPRAVLPARVNQHVMIIRPDPHALNSRYLHALLVEPRMKSHLLTLAGAGATRPALTKAHIAGLELDLPPLSEQRAIADVLGALDDKIDVDQRTVQLEEELATRLLEQAPTCVRLQDVATVQRAVIDPAASGTTMVDHFSLPAFDERCLPVRQAGAEIKSGKQRIDDVAVLVSRLNPHIPRVWYAVPEPGVLGVASTEFVVTTPLGAVTTEELWACCNSTSFTSSLGESVTGTTGSHQRVQATDVLAVEVGDPRSIPDVHRLALNAMVKSAYLLRKESGELTIVRDALLPKLLSGELRVRDVESLVEENDARILVDNTR